MILKAVFTTLVVFLAVVIVPETGQASEEEAKITELSPDLLALLRAEMAGLSGGVQIIALSIATADWRQIEETSQKMHGSYIMKESLTQAQAMELNQKLPNEFKQLDAAFHARAQKLRQAAASGDPELVVFQFSRMLEACAGCHSAFAGQRFPGFPHGPKEPHQH